jgi:hypothetical protein
MKRKLIVSVLTIAASVALVSKSQAQGSLVFENTDFGTLNAPVTFGMTANSHGVNGVAGVAVGSEFKADLLYSLDGGVTYTALTAANASPVGGAYPTPFFGTDGDTANGAGYFGSPGITIPGYSSGAISFIVRAFHGTDYATAAAANDWVGQSAAFSVPSIATGQSPAAPFPGGSLQAFVVTVPEPSIFALAGIGAAGLMAFRRKK